MTLPVITQTCLAAVVEKSSSNSAPSICRRSYDATQRRTARSHSGYYGRCFCQSWNQKIDPPTIELILQTCFCVLGVTMRATNAQVEADEMNKAWGETL